jgi:hypothetical protein
LLAGCPRVASVTPHYATPGSSVEFTLAGSGFTEKNIAVLASLDSMACGTVTIVSDTTARARCQAPNRSGSAHLVITNKGKLLGTYPIQLSTEDLSPGLQGVDVNANGIRDDIDRVIGEKYSATPELKTATERYARNFQRLMDATTKEDARAIALENSKASACLSDMFPIETDRMKYHALGREIEALTANTRERFKKYWDANRLLGGMVMTLQTCDRAAP